MTDCLKICAIAPCLAFLFLVSSWWAPAIAATARTMGVQPDGGVLVPTNQTVTPTGLVRSIEGDRPKDLALSPEGVRILTRFEVEEAKETAGGLTLRSVDQSISGSALLVAAGRQPNVEISISEKRMFHSPGAV